MKILLFIILITYNLYALTSLQSTKLEETSWPKGETLLTFLDKYNISQQIYFELSYTDKELCAEITADTTFQKLFDSQGLIQHVLIPISEEMQIHIHKVDGANYKLDIVPIEFQEIEQTLVLSIESSPYQDIVNQTGNKLLANELVRAFNKSLDFRRLRAGDLIAIKYKHKIRMGKYFGTPHIDVAMVEVRKTPNYIFKNDADGRYYDDKGRSLNSFFLQTPLQYNRISSPFDLKRFHPVLKIYRPHFGVDYAAPTGRRINSAADGRVIFVGNKGGYGKTIEIQHANGYKTLYAHLNGYAKGIRAGKNVKQGDLIGYVGTTGVSTGPHLHFGVYHHGRAVDPIKVINSSRKELPQKDKNIFLSKANTLKKEVELAIKSQPKPYKIESFELLTMLEQSAS
ncbi:peptidoglycan DD-metalloendopeptidase family protein [Arcobacter sp. FWKO B]|uniref:peptidoglycan DD-metalloendopeptidase family protein n=1 Tax=Arcobacter sp. FWKO B TaxID=2593672 RepID=UPI0018A692BF|nr:peptidoglycan DD-metalloendopeptidase family protein [Arcobacter sp. FWKO B]QOG11781.1 M23 family metallopeptidase [Arcobacter sp. FWKO B]